MILQTGKVILYLITLTTLNLNIYYNIRDDEKNESVYRIKRMKITIRENTGYINEDVYNYQLATISDWKMKRLVNVNYISLRHRTKMSFNII